MSGIAQGFRGFATFVLGSIILLERLSISAVALTPHAILDEVTETVSSVVAGPSADPRFTRLTVELALIEHAASRDSEQTGIGRAESIGDPFYGSLAIGGIAALNVAADALRARILLERALLRATEIRTWTGSDATSLHYLFALVPEFPEAPARDLLRSCRETLHAWKASDYPTGESVLALAKATTAAEPAAARDLLVNLALKSHHYYAAIEHLGAFLARRSPAEALQHAEAEHKRGEWPNSHYYLRAVLVEMAKTDFAGAFARIRGMDRHPHDAEMAAVELANECLKRGERQQAREVIEYLVSRRSSAPFMREAITRLEKAFANGIEGDPWHPTVTAAQIDEFLREPTARVLARWTEAGELQFRDTAQAKAFAATAEGLLDAVNREPQSTHSSLRADASGLIAQCLAALGELEHAHQLCANIGSAELRASYLLGVLRTHFALPAVMADWPIAYRPRTRIAVR